LHPQAGRLYESMIEKYGKLVRVTPVYIIAMESTTTGLRTL
jgi:hypothetical protein